MHDARALQKCCFLRYGEGLECLRTCAPGQPFAPVIRIEYQTSDCELLEFATSALSSALQSSAAESLWTAPNQFNCRKLSPITTAEACAFRSSANVGTKQGKVGWAVVNLTSSGLLAHPVGYWSCGS